MIKTIAIAFAALVVGLAAGWFFGRSRLEKQWQSPFVTGSSVMKPMPFGRSRKALRDICANDPVVYKVASIGSDEASTELHVVVENKGKCKVTEVAGTAYGFDAWGKPASLGKDGKHSTTFEAKDQSIEPGEQATVSKKLPDVDVATLAIAQVDATKCADGTTWARK